MTVLRQEKSVLDARFVAELVDVASRLNPGDLDNKALVSDYLDLVERLCGFVDIQQYANLLDFVVILIDGLELLANADRNPTKSELAFLQRVPEVLSEYLASPDCAQADMHFLELLRDSSWIRPISADEERVLTDTIEADSACCASKSSDESRNDDSVDLDDLLGQIHEAEPASVADMESDIPVLDIVEETQQGPEQLESCDIDGIGAEQQELVDLIRGELAEIIDSQKTLEQDLAGQDRELCFNRLTNMAEQAENISNAVSLIGLEGLSLCAKVISRNIDLFKRSADRLDERQISLLKEWPAKLLGYLQDINKVESVNAVLSVLSTEIWREPLDSAEYDKIKDLLENPVFLEEEQAQRQETATEQDVDLTLPDDVNQELLDGLLMDLPAQTEEFSTAIQNISEGGGTENIDIAQRIAHTLKGAANVVGVTGIATLTHHLEDILQAQGKSSAAPDEQLVTTLVRASDCLESMAEALLGIDSAPEDAVSVLQEVLDWANKLDNKQVSLQPAEKPEAVQDGQIEVNNDSSDVSPQTQENGDDKRQVQKSAIAENMLRVPVSLADDMLRLAGENLIYTSQIQDRINVIARKQEAIDLHNQSLQQLSYDLEHMIDIQGFMPGVRDAGAGGVFDPLELDEYHEIHTISRRLVEIAADSVELSNELDRDLSGLKELVVNQNQLHKEGEELVLRTRMVPIKTIIPRLKRGVRQASRLTGKKVELVVNDNDTFMDNEVLNDLIEPLMHLLRNAVDHGIEDEADRLVKGKMPEGKITLTFERQGNQIQITIHDDGQGLDTDVIRAKALASGLITTDDEISAENIQRLILEPGFTTRTNVTQVSGRGIGLDVVSVKIRALKGSVDISSRLNEGCSFTLSLPISSFSTHSLLVRSRQYIYAVSSHGVEEIIYPGLGEVRDVGESAIYQIGKEAYSAVLLDTLLDLPPDRRKIERSARPVLLVKDEAGSKTAVLVQDVLDSRDVVVKNMGMYIPKMNGIIGATVLGDGSVSPVIDLPELLHERNYIQQGLQYRSSKTSTSAQSRRVPFVLVVDDSLSARRSLAQFAEDLGLNVRTARDGMDALNIMENRIPDLLLVDMEMPKMNGLELTSHIRATERIKNIPIIMITSRSTDKHRKTAFEKGVNQFMVKPFDEDELAHHINSMLETA